MGIFTDHGRYYKAKAFLDWITSGGGVWFGFGLGSPNWDYFVKDASDRDILNVPVAVPRATAACREWLGNETITVTANDEIFFDTSYTEEGATIPPAPLPELTEIDQPSLIYLEESSAGTIMKKNGGSNPPLGEPPFPQTYVRDVQRNVYIEPSPTPPTQQTEQAAWVENKHKKEGATNGNPYGFLSLVKGYVNFVKPTTEEADNITTFRYGSQNWQFLTATEALAEQCHHLLLSCSVFPFDLHESDVFESIAHVRQVTVFHAPTEFTEQKSVRNAQCQYKSRYAPRIQLIQIPGDLETLVNDFMSQRRKEPAETSRYGYIVGF